MIIPINTAKRIAQFSDIKRAKVSAIAFTSNGCIIAAAHNRRVKGVPNKFTEHAEEVLIHKLNRIKAWDRFENINILVIRINTHGVVMAKPCIKCRGILESYPVNVFYTDKNGNIRRFT